MVSRTVKYILAGGAGLVVGGVVLSFAVGSNPIMIGASFMNKLFSIGNPDGQITLELREPAEEGAFTAHKLAAETDVLPHDADWPSYNRTVYGDRYSQLDEINAGNVADLEVVCSYDSDRLEGFQLTPLVVEGALIGTTAEDIFSLNPTTCEENWRVHQDSGIGIMPVNRGAAYVDGMVVRGFPDGFVRAYAVQTGDMQWETFIGDPERSLWLTSAAIGWDGMVFFGTAGGDLHDIRGRMFGLDAATGKVVWQFFTVPPKPDDTVHGPLGDAPEQMMQASWGNPPDIPITGGGTWTSYTIDPSTGLLYVPVGNPAPDFVPNLRPGTNLFTNTMLVLDAKTGHYVRHYEIMKDDWHDWDMSNPPILYTSRGGKDLMSFHPKDGHLYSYDLATDAQLYRQPVTKMLNGDERFSPDKEVYFCPGAVGGGEWSSAAFDPKHNLVFTGQNEWCTKAKIAEDDEVARAPDGMIWFGVAYVNPYKLIGDQDPVEKWGGWIYATDADTGEWKWRARANYPTISGITPTAGNIVMFGDMGGNFRIANASDGEILYDQHFDGAIAGGVITYQVEGKQYIAFTSGTSHPQWPVEPRTGKIVVLALP